MAAAGTQVCLWCKQAHHLEKFVPDRKYCAFCRKNPSRVCQVVKRLAKHIQNISDFYQRKPNLLERLSKAQTHAKDCLQLLQEGLVAPNGFLTTVTTKAGPDEEERLKAAGLVDLDKEPALCITLVKMALEDLENGKSESVFYSLMGRYSHPRQLGTISSVANDCADVLATSEDLVEWEEKLAEKQELELQLREFPEGLRREPRRYDLPKGLREEIENDKDDALALLAAATKDPEQLKSLTESAEPLRTFLQRMAYILDQDRGKHHAAVRSALLGMFKVSPFTVREHPTPDQIAKYGPVLLSDLWIIASRIGLWVKHPGLEYLAQRQGHPFFANLKAI